MASDCRRKAIDVCTAHPTLVSNSTAANNATSSSIGFYLAVVADADGCYTATLMKHGEAHRPKQLRCGSYAFVKVKGEPHLRVSLMTAKFGEAAGHPTLAHMGDVAYAGRRPHDACLYLQCHR